MNKQIRNAKAIQAKSRSNIVHPLGADDHGARYQVVSGQSGNVYDVWLRDASGVCTCDWAQHRPVDDQRSGCSHVLAALNFVAQENGDTSVSAWTDAAQAQRQHRRTLDIGDGVLVTVRA